MVMSTATVDRTGLWPAGHVSAHPPQGCQCLVDATLTQHYIRALVVVGWSLKAQGRMLGSTDGAKFRRILAQARVERATALRVADLFARLWDVPGPDQHAIAWAARQGWDAADPVVVARLVTGIRCPHTDADRDQAIRVLAAQGRSVTLIASRLRISHQKVRAVTGNATGAVAA